MISVVKRHFTVHEANALIPRLEGRIRRLQDAMKRAKAMRREMEMIKAVGHLPDGRLIMAVDFDHAQTMFQDAVLDTNMLIEEIRAYGCQLKDIERGLVDFPAFVDGKEVLLCWEMGEPDIAFYHDWYSGYLGRRPLARSEDDSLAE